MDRDTVPGRIAYDMFEAQHGLHFSGYIANVANGLH